MPERRQELPDRDSTVGTLSRGRAGGGRGELRLAGNQIDGGAAKTTACWAETKVVSA